MAALSSFAGAERYCCAAKRGRPAEASGHRAVVAGTLATGSSRPPATGGGSPVRPPVQGSPVVYGSSATSAAVAIDAASMPYSA